MVMARDSPLHCEKLRLQKKTMLNRVRLLKQENERLKTSGDIAPAPIFSDDDDSIDTFKFFDLSLKAVQQRREETKIYIKHITGTKLNVSKLVASDYHNCVPKCGYQMACFHSDWWWKGSQEA